MNSIAQQIVLRIVAALTGTTDAGSRVYYSRVSAIGRDDTPSISVREETEKKQASGNNADVAELQVWVSINVRGDPWTLAADPIAVQLHRVLLSDVQLAGLIAGIRHAGTERDDHEGDQTIGALVMEYQIRYLTRVSDISSNTIL